MMDRYPIYGGPLHGSEAEEAATVYADRQVMASFQSPDTPGKVLERPKYCYDLRKSDDGVRAFLPRDDADLLRAYQLTGGEPGDPAVEALLSEIHRRGLDI